MTHAHSWRSFCLIAALAVSPLAQADMDRTEATIVGAAVGGVIGSAVGDDLPSTLIGAAAGGLIGNLLSRDSRDYYREGRYQNRYYYGGRQFDNRQQYLAYREAVSRGMLRGHEKQRYNQYVRQHQRPAHAKPQRVAHGRAQHSAHHRRGRH